MSAVGLRFSLAHCLAYCVLFHGTLHVFLILDRLRLRIDAGAAIFLYNNAQHPHVESNTATRKDGLAEERESAAQEGHEAKESIGRRLSRCSLCQALPCLQASKQLV